MNVPNLAPSQRVAISLAVVAAAMSGVAWSEPSNNAVATPTPVLVAQAATGSAAPRGATMETEGFPAHQRGVRSAATQGPDALRRYVNRTRMIYGFYYNDFAPKE